MADAMQTYKQFLAAEHLSRALLMKHAQESCCGSVILYSDQQIADELKTLATRLGYRVEKISQPDPDAAREERRERVMEDAR